MSIRLLKFPILIALAVLFATASYAHDHRLCSRALAPTGGKVLWPDAPKRPFDVLKYQLTLDWRKIFDTQSQRYTGINTISIRLTQTTPNITLDAGLMAIDSILVNGVIVTPTPQPTNDEKLIIPLPQALQSTGSQVSLSISYRKDTLLNQGIYFYPKGTYDNYDKDYTTEDLAYTMSEPTDAHYWMPCMDQPYDKAESEISIIVPNGIETASNGSLLGKEAFTPTSMIWHWKSDEPIATYLMVADASTFIHWSQTHNRSSAPGDTVHLEYYAWPSDYYQDSVTDGSKHNAQYFLSRNTSQIMSWLEAKYGGFPFEKYGQVPVSPFGFGGMEHQTLTTVHRRWLRGYDEGIAHEMAHQWFGDKTTCETFKDLWLNEGFATFSEAIWAESWGGYMWYMNIIHDKAGGFFSDTTYNQYSTYDPPADNLFNYALTYCKGACVLHMLRRIVNNDTMFFNALRDYSNAFAFTTVNTAQFRDFIGPRLGLDLTEYFDQWIFGPLNPVYDIKWAQDANDMLYLRINQTQNVRNHFTMPIRFFAFHGNNIDTLIFTNNLRSQGYTKSLSYKIDSLSFDDDALILSRHTMSYSGDLAVRTATDTHSFFRVYRDGEELLCNFLSVPPAGKLELYNSVGMKLLSVSVFGGEIQKTLDIRNLPSGIFFIRYTNQSAGEVHSINIVR